MSVVAIAPRVVRARRRRPRLLLLISGCVTVAVLCPVLFLFVQLRDVGWSALSPLIFRAQTAHLLWNTLRLAAAVTACATVIGTSTAWVIERSDIRFRTTWTVLLVLPLAIPDFVIGFGWITAFPAVHGFWGSLLVMTLDLYPLVYLPVAASFRSADPVQEEIARSLGGSRLSVLFRVTLRQAAPSIIGGGLLVALSLFASFGAIRILGYPTFATEIFNEFHLSFDTPAASALSLILVVVSLVLLSGEGLLRGRGRFHRSTRQTATAISRHRLGPFHPIALVALVVVIGLSIGVPIGTLVYWMVQGSSTTLPAATTLGGAVFHTVAYSALAAGFSSVLAMPVAFATTRQGGRIAAIFERSTFVVQALPGLVVALALVYFSVHYVFSIYQSSFLLVFAYTVLFFPLALVALRSSLSQAPIGLEETGRSLGRGRFACWFRITVPLIAPGVAAAFSLVFLSSVTELTATLILVPTGVQTLATQFWTYQSNSAYGAASPYALVTVLIAAGPCILLARWFDRMPAAAGLS